MKFFSASYEPSALAALGTEREFAVRSTKRVKVGDRIWRDGVEHKVTAIVTARRLRAREIEAPVGGWSPAIDPEE